MTRTLRLGWFAFIYYVSWFLFGLGGLALNLACMPLLVLRDRERLGRRTRAITRGLFDCWLRWLHASNCIRITWIGFDRPLPTGVVYVANHPSLVDAPFLLARLPDTACIFKPALLRNPCIGPAALMCGYVSAGEQGVDLIRAAAARIDAGQSMLIFPEGTRTSEGGALNPIKPGFALIAQRARCGVQLIRVRTSPRLVRRGRPWWHVPPLPGWAEFTLDEFIPAEEITDPAQISSRVAARFLATLPIEPRHA